MPIVDARLALLDRAADEAGARDGEALPDRVRELQERNRELEHGCVPAHERVRTDPIWRAARSRWMARRFVGAFERVRVDEGAAELRARAARRTEATA